MDPKLYEEDQIGDHTCGGQEKYPPVTRDCLQSLYTGLTFAPTICSDIPFRSWDDVHTFIHKHTLNPVLNHPKITVKYHCLLRRAMLYFLYSIPHEHRI